MRPETPESPTAQLPEEWNQELLQSYTEVAELLKNRLISEKEAQNLAAIGAEFKVRITPYYSRLFSKEPDCPIRIQAIPHLGENDPKLPDEVSELCQKIYGRATPWHRDAIGDLRNLATPRLTHRYENRAILHLSSLCAVYCRFCFRKSHLNDQEKHLYEGSLESAFKYLENKPEIREVILTGGDPLSVKDAVLAQHFQRISKIPHIRSVRIHSRMAVTLPSRFTSSLLEVLGRDWGFQIHLVSHFNHTRELTAEARGALRRVSRRGITLLNQSVLLKGVNDSVEILQELFQGLYEMGVIPFYLHHPDWTPGTFHFRRSIEEGVQLVSELRGKIAGPSMPQYILDIPQGYGKISLLDPKVRKIRDLVFSDEDRKFQMGGAVYEIKEPATRVEKGGSHLYLDLYPRS